MSQTDDPRERLVRDALEAYKEEHRELSETWRSLDTKAQGTIAISGIFLAGILAFIRTLTQTTETTEKWLLTATAVLLTFSIFFSLLVLRIRTVTSAPLGESLAKLVGDLLGVEDGTTSDRLVNYCRDHAQMWNKANRDVEKANMNKAGHLMRAQAILAFAILCAGVFAVVEVWN